MGRYWIERLHDVSFITNLTAGNLYYYNFMFNEVNERIQI